MAPCAVLRCEEDLQWGSPSWWFAVYPKTSSLFSPPSLASSFCGFVFLSYYLIPFHFFISSYLDTFLPVETARTVQTINDKASSPFSSSSHFFIHPPSSIPFRVFEQWSEYHFLHVTLYICLLACLAILPSLLHAVFSRSFFLSFCLSPPTRSTSIKLPELLAPLYPHIDACSRHVLNRTSFVTFFFIHDFSTQEEDRNPTKVHCIVQSPLASFRGPLRTTSLTWNVSSFSIHSYKIIKFTLKSRDYRHILMRF